MSTTNISAEEIKVFKSFFLGRGDAYGLESSPSPITVREPLTDSLIHDHLKGIKRIGGFLVGKDNKVKTACIDLDQEDKKKLERIVAALIDNGFFPYIERSKSKGYHIWIFFDEPIEAGIVRKVLSQVLKDAGIVGIEIFPKQDSLNSNNGLGNYVFLPLHGASIKQARTLFVNFELNPYPDQWQYLSKIHRTKAENILSMAEKMPNESNAKQEKPDSILEGSLDVAKYLIHYKIPFQEKKEPNRTIFQLLKCFFGEGHTTGDGKGHAAIIQGIDGKLTYHCMHEHCQNRKWEDTRKAISGDDSLAQFLKGYTESKAGKARNLAEDLREWVEMSHGNFTTSQIYNDLDVKTTADKTFVRVNLHRMVEKEIIERGISNGTFRKVDRENSLIEIEETISKPLPLKWPGGLEDCVKLMRKTTVGVAGTMQAGKTAYLLNVAWLNKGLMPTYYFTSEFGGDELRERLEPFGYSMDKWRAITFIERSRDFQDGIYPDGLNLIDYLEVSDEGEFYKMGIQIKRIYEKLNQGVAVIGLQKKFGSDFGYGGQPTADKPRLYITLEKGILKIVKAKLWTGEVNPNGMTRRFKLVQGARFIWEPWQQAIV